MRFERLFNARIQIISTYSQVKDVRVPEQLMRAMAAEAEAARNARAKVGFANKYFWRHAFEAR